ncbi:MAG: sulfite exporter TauE/SafE family protein [Acidobacteriaceae bacterium]|nr:sulfite exporter TauE/SafE family protein [Acidobacteriaceae bacterium]
MEFVLGFIIALAISLTGVGAGSMTVPLLIVFLGVPPAIAVGTALTFGAIVKIVSIPLYAVRRQVNLRILLLLLAGGVPGVILGSTLLETAKNSAYNGVLYLALGTLIVGSALFHLYRVFRPQVRQTPVDRSRALPWFALPIGAEVGFSSAGAGALGSLLLLGLTKLSAAEVVGTDLCFGLGVSLIGSAIQIVAGNYDPGLLWKLVAGGVLGALTGSMLAGRIAQRPLRLALLVALVVLGCQLAAHGATAQLQALPAALTSSGVTRAARGH